MHRQLDMSLDYIINTYLGFTSLYMVCKDMMLNQMTRNENITKNKTGLRTKFWDISTYDDNEDEDEQ